MVEIRFQDTSVIAKGTNLEPLYDALARMAVERIKVCPEKYGVIARKEGMIEELEIRERKQPIPPAKFDKD